MFRHAGDTGENNMAGCVQVDVYNKDTRYRARNRKPGVRLIDATDFNTQLVAFEMIILYNTSRQIGNDAGC